MDDFDRENYLDKLYEIRDQHLDLLTKFQILETTIQRADGWALPEVDYSEDSYDYVPIAVGEFIEWLIELDKHLCNDSDFRHDQQKYRPFSFIEIGCGIGRNLNIVKAQELLPAAKVVGFDLTESYIEVARNVFGLGQDAFVGNCMDFDYSGFDVLYFYRPLRDDDLETEFEKQLIASVKKGAIIIGAASIFLEDSRELMPIGDSGRLFKKL